MALGHCVVAVLAGSASLRWCARSLPHLRGGWIICPVGHQRLFSPFSPFFFFQRFDLRQAGRLAQRPDTSRATLPASHPSGRHDWPSARRGVPAWLVADPAGVPRTERPLRPWAPSVRALSLPCPTISGIPSPGVGGNASAGHAATLSCGTPHGPPGQATPAVSLTVCLWPER